MNNSKDASCDKTLKIIYSEDEIAQRVKSVADQITEDYKDKQDEGIAVIAILKGAAIFMADLVRHMNLDIVIDFMSISSYNNSTKSSGKINLDKDISIDIFNKHVIIIEDIIDTGNTINYVINHLKEQGAKSVAICSLLNKNISHDHIIADYTCFNCSSEFIVGYGLDYNQKYRNIPYISSIDYELTD